MVVSEIRSLYTDEDDLLRTVLKRIYEQWDAEQEQWHLKKIEFIYEDPEFPVPSDNPAVAVEQRHGWLIPPEWEFQSEVWEYERKPVSEVEYEHEGEVTVIREWCRLSESRILADDTDVINFFGVKTPSFKAGM